MSSTYKTDRYNIPQFPGDAFTPVLAWDYTADVLNSLHVDASAAFVGRCPDGLVVMTVSDGDDVVVTTMGGRVRTYTALPALFVIPCRVRSVGGATTATVEAIV